MPAAARPEGLAHSTPALPGRLGRGWVIALWLLFALAQQPTLLDLARHYVDRPWTLYSAVFFALFGLESVRTREPRARPGLGLALVALAMLLQYAMVAAELSRAARPGLALGMIGIALALGRPGPRHALLAVWAIPV